MVRRPLTVGTRVKVQLAGTIDPPVRYGVIMSVWTFPPLTRCQTHPTDPWAYDVSLTTGDRGVFCDSQVTEV